MLSDLEPKDKISLFHALWLYDGEDCTAVFAVTIVVKFEVLVLVIAVLEAISLTGGNLSLVVLMFLLASWLLVVVPRVADLDRTQADVDSPTSHPFAP
jgi:hypothetical protein